MASPSLFDPLELRGLLLRNRMVLPPMCQYRATGHDGLPTDWHLMHYGARAAGGFGLIVIEATAINPEGRISPNCLGLWNDEQSDAFKPIVKFAHSQGARIGVQLIHAGRKASTYPALPGNPDGSVPISEGGWQTKAPSALSAFDLTPPVALSTAEIEQVVADFVAAAQRAVTAGFDTVQIHAAHGYLLHQFLSPVSNQRDDDYGGSLDNRMRLTLEVISAIRAVLPDSLPLMLRISATDWLEDAGIASWTVSESQILCQKAQELGVDIIDVSSGGLVPAPIVTGPGYQLGFAQAIKSSVTIPVIAVGQLGDPLVAQAALDHGSADAIDIGRAALVDAAWPLHAAEKLGIPKGFWPIPPSYQRGF